MQQRTAQAELEDHRRQVQELSQNRKQLQNEVADLNERLNAETAARNAEAGMAPRLRSLSSANLLEGAKRQLQMRLQELEISSVASSSMHGGTSALC